ncbi:hypothetical protein PRK78_005716 [Emydomyces testavorans]|uniref:DNA recombination and repair protein Rad51-like C-terminal domain-containing protein n=1 Tax=Emydomyces testavorans TaxID=2070801 RepID=A0AAF0DMQ0_9EURO|nr:hypothetical protein PRK78_005716 [Emydomyces testavorans]
MGAECFGAKLLAEVQEESLADILRSLRNSHVRDSPQQLLGIPPLDDILSILNTNDNNNHPIIEITSPSSADGKTALLYYAAALAVLPARLDNGVVLGGRAAAVIWLDTDGRFDASWFTRVVRTIVRKRVAPSGHEYGRMLPTTVLDEALRHVHVFRPQGSATLLATVRSIPRYLFGGGRHYSRGRAVHAVVVDSASAFYWQDWREEEVSRIPGAREDEEEKEEMEMQMRSTTMYAQGGKKSSIDIHAEIVSRLRELQSKFSCVILFTTAGLYPSRTADSLVSFRPYLPYPWPVFPTLRLVVRRDPVRPFPGEMTVDEAMADAAARQSVVQRGQFSGWVDLASVPVGVRSELGRKGGFAFRIAAEGVEFDS